MMSSVSSGNSSPSASNSGNKTSPMKRTWLPGLDTLSGSMNGVTGRPSDFSAALCAKNSCSNRSTHGSATSIGRASFEMSATLISTMQSCCWRGGENWALQPAVPYFDQRVGIGPLSRNEMAYLKRLVEEEDDLLETSTEVNPGDGDGSDAWDNSCVSEAVNPGGFSNEESSEEAPTEVHSRSVPIGMLNFSSRFSSTNIVCIRWITSQSSHSYESNAGSRRAAFTSSDSVVSHVSRKRFFTSECFALMNVRTCANRPFG
uniref:Uncharacterized protein n=1 Tax=Anopheles farauti TaxID=69004 RepID=A0A182QQC8_9DIPT